MAAVDQHRNTGGGSTNEPEETTNDTSGNPVADYHQEPHDNNVDQVDTDRRRQIRSSIRRPNGGDSVPANTQLEFTQAMHDFKVMFPEMDDDVIEVVLRANRGAVDATIDQLLAMSTDNENERLRTEMDATENAEAPPGYSPVTPPPSYQQAVPDINRAISKRSPPVIIGEGEAASTKKTDNDVPLRVIKNWCPPLLGALPIDFLRINVAAGRTSTTSRRIASNQPRQHSIGDGVGMMTTPREMTNTNSNTTLCSEVIQQKIEENERKRQMNAACGDDDPELARCLEDERIALFLQNEEFMCELRSNRDFLSTLERDSDSDSDTERKQHGSASATQSTKQSLPSCQESEDVFREKLTNMGKKSKHKFAQLARLFSRQKKRGGAKQSNPYARLSDGGVVSMPSRDHLLMEDDEDDEENESDHRLNSDEEESGRPQNQYHSFKNSSSPSLQRCNSNAT